MRIVPISEANRVKMEHTAGPAHRRDFVGQPGILNTDPQAFLVERTYPNPVIHPHFHDVDQFQIFIGGDGRIGKTPVEAGTFQYSDAYTPYGPIVGNDDGVCFFTLRAIASGGHWPMPGNRDKMPGRAGRYLAGTFDLTTTLSEEGRMEREILLEEEDGLTVVGLKFGPNGTYPEKHGETGAAGGGYILVFSGSVKTQDTELVTKSLVQFDADEDIPAMSASDEGANVLLVTFARPSDRPGSNPELMRERDPYTFGERAK
jgi:hypothetical protein